ncbi:MAG: hypothetical protein M5U22_09780 [Thermoleophilia bacterium]|nr:hypothetical protein [Thermoleophilia bacterium]
MTLAAAFRRTWRHSGQVAVVLVIVLLAAIGVAATPALAATATMTRLSSGLIELDDFDSDTLLNYQAIRSLTGFAVTGGALVHNTTTSDKVARLGQTGARVVTARTRNTDPANGGNIYLYLAHATAKSGSNNWAGYRLEYDVNTPGGPWSVGRYSGGTSTDLGVSSAEPMTADVYTHARLLKTETGHIVARFGSSLDGVVDAGLHNEVAVDRVGWGTSTKAGDADWLEARTDYHVTVQGVPAGGLVEAASGGKTASATESAGAAVVDCQSLLFPLDRLRVMDAAGTVLVEVSPSDYADMGGGDTYVVQVTGTTYTITPSAGPGGQISPATAQTVNPGASLTFTITPDAGYHISDVVVDGASVGPVGTYDFADIGADHTIAASFAAAATTYTITPSAGPGGQISPATAQTVNPGASLTFTITPDAGYHISDVVVDGASVGPIGTYDFADIGADHTIAASFAADAPTGAPAVVSLDPAVLADLPAGQAQIFTAVFADPNGATNLKRMRMIVGTAITGVGGVYIYLDENRNKIFLRNAANTAWLSGTLGTTGTLENERVAIDLAQSSMVKSGTTLTLAVSMTFKSTFLGQKTVWLRAEDDGGLDSGWIQKGSVTVTAAPAATTYTITPSAGPGGQISPATAQTVNPGASLTFTITPDAGYHISDVVVDGASVGPVGTYDFADIGADHTIAASFAAAATTYTITPSAGPGGQISPATAQTVNPGASLTFTITPDAGYHISDVVVDGASVGPIGTYDFADIGADHTIAASFAADAPTGAPAVVSLDPAVLADLPAGQAQIFTAVFADPNGATNLKRMRMIVGTAITGVGGVYIYLDENRNKIFLRNAANTAWLSGTLGTTGTLENERVAIDLAQSSMVKSGTPLTLAVSMTFKSTFLGQKTVWLRAEDDGGLDSGWIQKGSVTVTGEPS